jgi:2-amino-4-hydroxy-6-hydroxymethyldihydropteridine diphosphokinase
VKVAGYWFQVAGYWFQVAGYWFQVAGSRLPVYAGKFLNTGSKFKTVHLKLQITNLKPALNHAYLLLGGNLGNREGNLRIAIGQIEQHCGTLLKASALYETAAWGNTEQPAFLNQAVIIKTPLSATALLKALLAIELKMGRVREAKYAPRVIDIDILFFNRDIISQPGLEVPHPEIANRRFVLQPLAQLVPHKIHPVLKKSVQQLLAACPDKLPVKRYTP